MITIDRVDAADRTRHYTHMYICIHIQPITCVTSMRRHHYTISIITSKVQSSAISFSFSERVCLNAITADIHKTADNKTCRKQLQMKRMPNTTRYMCAVLYCSAGCITSIGQIIKSVYVFVSESVSPSHQTSWTLYRSQSSSDLHQTCHQGRVARDLVTKATPTIVGEAFIFTSELFFATHRYSRETTQRRSVKSISVVRS